ncbi:MAG: MFS transporter, partial [Alphaproteobacteria bacterium]
MSTETASPRRAAAAFIYVTILLDSMAGFIAAPVLPKLVTQLSGGDPARVAEIFGAFGTLFFLFQLFAAPIQGSLSDSFGRRPVILASSFGLGIDFVVMALAPTLPWLFVGRVFSGAFAGGQAVAYAYMIDITPPEKRTRMFAVMGAVGSAGIVIGPAIGGLIASYDLRAPFWVAAILSILNGFYGLFILPESLGRDRRARFSWRLANPVGVTMSLVRRFPVLIWWGIASLIVVLALIGTDSIFAVYLTYRFSWSPQNIGLYLAILGGWSLLAQGLVVPLITKRIGDRASIIGGAMGCAVFICLMGLVPFGVGYVGLAIVWLLFLMINGVSLNSLLSRVVGDSDQGQLQGAARSLNSVAGLIAPGLW